MQPTLLSAISTSASVLGMVRGSWFMLSNDRRLHLDMRDQPALRQPFQAEAKKGPGLLSKGCVEKIGVGIRVSPGTAGDSGKVSLQEDGEISQRAASSISLPQPHFPLWFFPLIPAVKHGCQHPPGEGTPKADSFFGMAGFFHRGNSREMGRRGYFFPYVLLTKFLCL